MQELQQKGKCHFSRSQSWDVAMKKSESFPYLSGETSKGMSCLLIKLTIIDFHSLRLVWSKKIRSK